MRDGWKIRAWLLEKGISVSEVARKAGVPRPHTSQTIHGKRNHRRVLQILVDLKCPKRLLALPEDMKTKEAA
jgi:hypothetical protein